MIILKTLGFIASFLVVGFIVMWFKFYIIPDFKWRRNMFLSGVAMIKMARRKPAELKKSLKAVGKGMIKIALGF